MPIALDNFVRDVPLSGDIYASQCSDLNLDSADSVRFANGVGGRLQSIGEAVVFRYFDFNKSFEHQKTSTLNLIFKKGKKYFSAFVENPNDTMGMCLYRNGIGANRRDNNLLCPADDIFFLDLLMKAKKAHRIVPVRNARWHLWTEQKKGSSVYGRDSHAVALFGHPELSELNAGILNARDCLEGHINELGLDETADIIKNEKYLAVFAMSLGGGPDGRDSVAYAGIHFPYVSHSQFIDEGRARGVARVNFS